MTMGMMLLYTTHVCGVAVGFDFRLRKEILFLFVIKQLNVYIDYWTSEGSIYLYWSIHNRKL